MVSTLTRQHFLWSSWFQQETNPVATQVGNYFAKGATEVTQRDDSCSDLWSSRPKQGAGTDRHQRMSSDDKIVFSLFATLPHYLVL